MVPQIPVAPGAVYPNAQAFAQQWNQLAAAAGTGVPQIRQSDVQKLENGPTSDTFVVYLSDDVGLLGVVRKSDQSVAQVIEVWVPGGNQPASSTLFRNAFDILTQTLSPELDQPARAALATSLGITATTPPFPSGTNITTAAASQSYQAFTRDTTKYGQASAVSVVDGRTR